MPPEGLIASMPCRIVGRSFVGPVTAPDTHREGRDDHAVERRQILRERGRRALHEIHSPRHARAAVDHQRERRSDSFLPDDVELLRNVVFEDGELRRRNALEETARLVLNRRLDQYAVHFGSFGDLEGLEDHFVLRFVAKRIGHFNRDFASLEWIVVDPLGRIGRTIRDRAEQLRIDVEAHLPGQDVLRMLHLGDDPNGSRETRAAERGGNANAEGGFLERSWTRGCAEREQRG